MSKNIITISREFGAGGRPVGRLVAEKLGLPFYDKQLVEHIAEETGFSTQYIEDHGEHAPGKSIFSYAFTPQGVPGVMNGLSTTDYLWNVQCSVIQKLADNGPCIIVGRNADYILKNRTDVLHVFLHAAPAFRARRILEEYYPTEPNPEALCKERDKRRSLNYQHYTGGVWGMSQNYDLSLNTGLLGFEYCADIIIRAAKEL